MLTGCLLHEELLMLLVLGTAGIIIIILDFIKLKDIFGHPIFNFSKAGQNTEYTGSARLYLDKQSV